MCWDWSTGGHKAHQLGLWQIEVVLSGQQASGKIPREIWKRGPRSFGKHGIQPPGILTLASNRLYQAAESDQEKESVRKAIAGFYSQFVKNHEWFWLNTRTDNGLCTWKTLDLITRSPILYEYYNPLTGDGLGSPHYGWTSSLYIDLILGTAVQPSTRAAHKMDMGSDAR